MRSIDEEPASDFFNKLTDIFKQQNMVPVRRGKKKVLIRQLLWGKAPEDLRNQCLYLNLLRTD